MARRTKDQYNWDKLEFDETILPRHFSPRNSRDIRFVVVHHMMIPDRHPSYVGALDACYNTWLTRQASAHYGVAGDLVRQYVWDKDYAWANGNTYANDHSISIEHANETMAPQYRIRDLTWKTGARLTAYVHKVKDLGLPTAGTTIRKHNDFSATGCPGPHLLELYPSAYENEARRVYREIMGQAPIATPTPPSEFYMVEKGDTLAKIARKLGVKWQEIAKENGLSNPDHLYIGQKLHIGKKAVQKTVEQVAEEVLKGHFGNGLDRINRLKAQGFDPLAVQRVVNQLIGR